MRNVQIDKSKDVIIQYSEKCSWVGYENLLEGLQDFLFKEPVQQPHYKSIGLIDNLHAAIYAWNIETDMLKTIDGGNPMKEWLDSKNVTVLSKYQKYFSPI